MLDPNPAMKHIAYDDKLKRRVEVVSQSMCIKYKLSPSPTFYYLVAKLNTDLNGNVIGDSFVVEYLQLSESINNEFADAIQEQGVGKSISLQKVKKTSGDGRDFSYIKPTNSMYGIDDNPSLLKKINDLRNNKEFIDGCWKMIDAETSINEQEYVALLAGENSEIQAHSGSQRTQELPGSQRTPALPGSQRTQTPSNPQQEVSPMTTVGDDFAKSNDFEDGGSFDAGDDLGSGFDNDFSSGF